MSTPERRLHVVGAKDEPIRDLAQQVHDLTLRVALAKSLLGQRNWPGCEHQAELVRMALDGATIDQLKEEDQRK